jgi:hypothetical protein
MLAATAGAAFAGAIVAGVFAAVLSPQERAREARWAEERASSEATIGDLRAAVAADRSREDRLESELAAARDATRRLQSDLDDARRQITRGGPGKPPRRTYAPSPRAEPGLDLPACPPGSLDPMCVH